MLDRMAAFVVRRRRYVLIAALVAFVVSGAVGGGVADKLSSGGFEDPSAESARVQPILEETFQSGTPNVLLLVSAREGTVDDPAVAEAGRAVVAELAASMYEDLTFTQVVSYWDLPPGNPLRNDDGTRALVLARFPDDDNILVDAAQSITDDFRRDDPASAITVGVGGFGPIFAEVGETIESDLVRAETIAIPITLVLLLLVFGSVVAAGLPLLIGALSVVGTFLVLLIINSFTEVSVFALNLTTAMGLGLAIDYSLFIVSRYREELRNGLEPDQAVIRTVRTAGKTVLFSSLTVAVSLCALLVFNIAFLRSFAYAGVAVSLLAGFYALVVLPAVLAALGRKVDALTLWRRSTTPPEEGFWHRMATFVMRRPIGITAVVIAVLVVLGSPALRMELTLPDDRVVPPGSEARDVSDIIRNEFSSEEAGAMSVVLTGLPAQEVRAPEIDAYARQLAVLPDVARVDAETGLYCGSAGTVSGITCEPGQPLPVPPEQAQLGRFARADATYLSVVPDVEPLSREGEDLVEGIRDVDIDREVLVGGQAAQLVDSKASLFGDLPLAIAIIAIITFVLLFLMFGSVIVPLKALVLNLLSLSATFGAMVWIFQDGRLTGLLDFDAIGALDLTTPILMFCVAFGLSMDYEVFLLSRIKEEHDRGADNVRSVAVGLERTGRLVTAAALLISVVFLSFATSEVTFIKLFGVGLTLAVLLDAFIIRGTLVPAFMRLAGEANWWAPPFLRRVHDRIGITEGEHTEPEPVREPVAVASTNGHRPTVAAPAGPGRARPPRREPLRAPGR